MFDGNWHHLALVDQFGEGMVLYVDGLKDAEFQYIRDQYTHTGFNTPIVSDLISIGAEVVNADLLLNRFKGLVDDVQIFDYALSKEEVTALLPPRTDCPQTGDTRCGNVQVSKTCFLRRYEVSVTGSTDGSGQKIFYDFQAETADGRRIHLGPQDSNKAVFDLDVGLWTVTVTVDDDPLRVATVEAKAPPEPQTVTHSVVPSSAGIACFGRGLISWEKISVESRRLEIREAAGRRFSRGDVNADGVPDLSDAVSVLGYLFLGQAAPGCLKAADANDGGDLDLSDGIYILAFLFTGGPAPAQPFPGCGVDPTEDPISCESSAACP